MFSNSGGENGPSTEGVAGSQVSYQVYPFSDLVYPLSDRFHPFSPDLQCSLHVSSNVPPHGPPSNRAGEMPLPSSLDPKQASGWASFPSWGDLPWPEGAVPPTPVPEPRGVLDFKVSVVFHAENCWRCMCFTSTLPCSTTHLVSLQPPPASTDVEPPPCSCYLPVPRAERPLPSPGSSCTCGTLTSFPPILKLGMKARGQMV